MRTSRLVWCLVLLFSVKFSSSQTYTYQDVQQLVAHSNSDSVAMIERMAALKFHELINQYRQENGLSKMAWNETIWVATINHNSWMERAGNLSHHQEDNTSNFTGISPGDRLKYAENGATNMGWTAENALYNYSAQGSSIEQIATNIAKRSFVQWKNSPGHNKNMLSGRHGSHAVAFKLSDGRVWGTDLFSASNGLDEPIPSLYLAKQKNSYTTKRFSTYKNKRLVQEELAESLFNDFNLRGKNWSNKSGESKSKAYRLARKRFRDNDEPILYVETEVHVEKKFFGLLTRKVYTFAVVIQQSVSEFDASILSEQLSSLVKENQPINTKSRIDQTIVLKKRNNNVYVTLVSMVSNPNKAS